jgi:hypothetical protein
MFQTNVVDKIKTHIFCSIIFFFFENCAVYEIMWKNIVEPDRPQMTIWRMRIACWIPKATNTHLEYVILIAVALHQWLHECASMLLLCVHYISCLTSAFARELVVALMRSAETSFSSASFDFW